MTVAHAPAPGAPPVRYGSPAGRWVLAALVLGSGMAFLDGTAVNVALPQIGRDLGADVGGLQWTVNAYALVLAGLLLLGGALGDRLGRRRVFVWGVAWFAAASLACALAPSIDTLIAARALQGAGAALLTPAALAIVQASFHPDDRGAAVGAWIGLTGVAAAAGPFLGGWLVQVASWRLVFLINLPLAAVVLAARRRVPESRDPRAAGRRLDALGTSLAALGLGGVAYALTEGPRAGWDAPGPIVAAVVGPLALGCFLVAERRAHNPLVPLEMFSSRTFSAANGVTFLVYGALAAALFLVPIQLQRVAGYEPLGAGAALVPMTAVMLLLSARAGRLASRVGPRLPMTAGPIVAAAGMLLLVRVGPDAGYAVDVLPAMLVLGAGMALTVAPLTTTVLAAAGTARAGVASGINNGVARVASLLAVAAVPTAAGIGGAGLDPAVLDAGFETGVVIGASLCAGAGLVAFLGLRDAPAPDVPVPVHCSAAGPPAAGAHR